MKPWMIVLAAAAGLILLLVLLFAFGIVRVRIRFREKIQRIRVTVSVVGIPITLFSGIPEKGDGETDENLSECKNPKKALKAELRRKRKLEKANLKKQKKQEKRAKKKQARKAAGAAVPKPNLKENLEMVQALLKKLQTEAEGKFHIRVRKLHLTVVGEDAAATAILYAEVTQALSALLRWGAEEAGDFRYDPEAVSVTAGFVQGQIPSEIDVSCFIRLFAGAKLALRLFSAYRRERAAALAKAKKRTQAA